MEFKLKRINLLIASATAALIMTGCGASGHGPHWSYEGHEGPKHWGELASAYKLCQTGKEQSPINLEVTENTTTKELVLDYKVSKLNEINNGHTIQFNYTQGSTLTVNGKKYDLLQFHFHVPSEHTQDAAHFPLEFHLVHKSAEGELAVIGIMVKEGEENGNFRKIIDNLVYDSGRTVLKDDVEIDMFSILPDLNKFFHYEGSLTTPPCSEKVQWFVLQTPIEFSKDQLAAFEKAYKGNNRPVQPLNERTLYTK